MDRVSADAAPSGQTVEILQRLLRALEAEGR
jgi:hypothetical protein